MVTPSIIHRFKDPYAYTGIAIVYKIFIGEAAKQEIKIEYFCVYELDATVL